MASRAILSNFSEEKRTQNYPQHLSGIGACTFSDNLSRKSCIQGDRYIGVSFELSRKLMNNAFMGKYSLYLEIPKPNTV